jgi:hypothetical protein
MLNVITFNSNSIHPFKYDVYLVGTIKATRNYYLLFLKKSSYYIEYICPIFIYINSLKIDFYKLLIEVQRGILSAGHTNDVQH